MCFFLFPKTPKKRRYSYPIDTSEEELIPRKKRQTHYSARPVKYEPLRGHGVKRAPVKAQPTTALRGRGVKREQPQGRKRTPSTVEVPTTPKVSAKSVKSTPSRRRADSGSAKRRSHQDAHKRRSDSFSARSPRQQYQQQQQEQQQQYATPEMTQRYQHANTAQYRYSYPTAATSREHPLYTNQTPNYVYSLPKCYYHDTGAVRAATSHALQESMFDPARYEANRVQYSRHLRRQPAYTQLRY